LSAERGPDAPEALDPTLRKLLVCPVCRGSLEDGPRQLICRACRLAYPIVEGVPWMMPHDAVRYEAD
jgi:uncharacterized protein YbaR (Trm112 family)